VSRTRAVFFDAGHTLLYAHPDLGTIYAETTASFGLRLPPAAFLEAFKPAFAEGVRLQAADGRASDAQDLRMWRGITAAIHRGVPELSAVPFDAWFEALWGRFGDPASWRLYDDVESSLRSFRERGLILGVVSNWDTRLRRIAEGLGLGDLVDFLVISAEAGVRKPDPGIFRLALEKAGVSPEEAIHVGDLAEEDVEGARRAGIRGVLIERTRRLVFPSGRAPRVGSLAGLAGYF
jgi:putative hydrolase of the HAD superfamily